MSVIFLAPSDQAPNHSNLKIGTLNAVAILVLVQRGFSIVSLKYDIYYRPCVVRYHLWLTVGLAGCPQFENFSLTDWMFNL